MYKHSYAFGLAALAIAASALFVQPVMASAAANDTVIAIVNGDKIMKKDVMNAIKKLPLQASADTQKVFPMVVDQIINEKLIDDATHAAKVEDSEEYKAQLDALKAQLAKEIYVEKILKDKVSDAAVKAEYGKFKKENEGKEEVHARHLLVKTEEEAKQAIKDLDDGAKFEDLVKQRSSDTLSAAKGGDLGWFSEEDMLPEFSAAAFKIKPGHFSEEPVKTKFGWHVIKVEDKRERKVPDIKQVEPVIRQKLTNDAVQELIGKLRSKADIKMFDMDGKPLGNTPRPKATKGDEKSDKSGEAPAKDAEKSAKDDSGDSKE